MHTVKFPAGEIRGQVIKENNGDGNSGGSN